MPFARDKRDRMFNASNLNGLYSRFDEKCTRVLDNKSPLLGKHPDVATFGIQIPYGVIYQYRKHPEICRVLDDSGYLENYKQSDAYVELSKLEVKHLDVTEGQVYLDKYLIGAESFSCDIKKIHFSFELLRKEVNGEIYDVHLGWDPPTGTSYVRGSLGSEAPTLPPGRIHKHRLAVAEIFCETESEFKILNTYQRYDCWRIHNFWRSPMTVYLQNPDGSSERHTVVAGACRSFRRRNDGTWQTTWPNGSPCRYFFPYFKGDIPFFAGGPPTYNWTDAPFVALEKSAAANNVANPFLLTQWFRALGGWHDPYIPYDIRQTYPDVYGDPENANTPIGDLIFTWGRARVVRYNTVSGVVNDDFIEYFKDTTQFLPTLRNLGIDVTVSGDILDLVSNQANTAIRIYPIDCNVFFGSALPYWEIAPTTTYISIAYPTQYWTQNKLSPLSATTWAAGNVPTWLETIRTLRRRIAVEEGWLNSYDDAVDIAEEKVSRVSLTPFGLQVRAVTNEGIEAYDALATSDIPSYERTANKFELFAQSQNPLFSNAIGWSETAYSSATRIYYITLPYEGSGLYGNVFPQISVNLGGYAPAVNCAYVPAGGPWGFSSSVYDSNLARVYTVDPIDPTLENVFGSDFWINKWGGRGGVDASVRILGQPNKTLQQPIQTTTEAPPLVADDIFKDKNNPIMACSVPWAPPFGAHTGFEQSWLADIKWVDGEQYFNFPFISTFDAVNYAGVGPFYHKIPKSAFLWNLLEYTVRSWTRGIPLCHAEIAAPIMGFSAGGTLVPTKLGLLIPPDITTRGIEGGVPVWYLSEDQYDALIANGVAAQYAIDPATLDKYWYVNAILLATYGASQGFTSCNFDATNEQPHLLTPIAATEWIAVRAYGTGETTQIASYFDSYNGKQMYRAIRYVNLRLGNELAS